MTFCVHDNSERLIGNASIITSGLVDSFRFLLLLSEYFVKNSHLAQIKQNQNGKVT